MKRSATCVTSSVDMHGEQAAYRTDVQFFSPHRQMLRACVDALTQKWWQKDRRNGTTLRITPGTRRNTTRGPPDVHVTPDVTDVGAIRTVGEKPCGSHPAFALLRTN